MPFRLWYRWVVSLPWRYRWFILLMILRPFIDQFYELKRISPLLSPLYWAGILTILLSWLVIVQRRTDKSKMRPYQVFTLWAVIYILGLVLNFTFKHTWSTGTVAIFMKYITIVFLFFFSARFVRTDGDIEGIMTTFLYSCFIIIAMVVFSGNFRIKGLYDTIQNIAFYISLGYIANTYLYLRSASIGKGNIWKYFLGLVVVLATFASLQHIATMAIILVITAIFLYFSRKISLPVMLSSMIMILAFWYFFGNQITQDYIEPQLNTEIAALQGHAESARMFHGRMSRWEVFIPMFFRLNPFAVAFGCAYGIESRFDLLMESNIHNDLLRIMLAAGVIGLALFLYFLYLIFRRLKFLKTPEKFLLTSVIALILLYSVTAYPTIYPSVLYVSLPAFSFALKPLYRLYGEKKDSSY